MEEKVYELKIENVFPNPNQPRKTFDDETIKELAGSISAYGVISPIIVQPKGLDRYMIIAGERRYRAVKSLGKETIPAIIKNFDEKNLFMDFFSGLFEAEIWLRYSCPSI